MKLHQNDFDPLGAARPAASMDDLRRRLEQIREEHAAEIARLQDEITSRDRLLEQAKAALQEEMAARTKATDEAIRLAEKIERLKPLAELGRRIEALPLFWGLHHAAAEVWTVEDPDAVEPKGIGKTALEALRAAGIGG